MNLALLYVFKMQESGLIEITPLICTLAISGQCPVFSNLNPLRVHRRAAAVAEGHYILCLLIRQVTFFVHSMHEEGSKKASSCEQMERSRVLTKKFRLQQQILKVYEECLQCSEGK